MYVCMCQYVHVCGSHVHAPVYGHVLNTLTCTSKGLSKHKCVSDVVFCVWMRAYVCLRAPKYAYTRMHCIVSSPRVRMYVSLNVFVYTCMQTSIYICELTNMHTCIHACIGRCTYTCTHDASLSLRVPAQGSLQQSADDAA